MKNICQQCGKKFDTTRTFAKFCSDACRMGSYRDRKKLNVNAMVEQAIKLFEYKLDNEYKDGLIPTNDLTELNHILGFDLNHVFNNAIKEIECKSGHILIREKYDPLFRCVEPIQLNDHFNEEMDLVLEPIIDSLIGNKKLIKEAAKKSNEMTYEETEDLLNHFILLCHTYDNFYKTDTDESKKVIFSINSEDYHVELCFSIYQEGFVLCGYFDAEFKIGYNIYQEYHSEGELEKAIYIVTNAINSISKHDEVFFDEDFDIGRLTPPIIKEF